MKRMIPILTLIAGVLLVVAAVSLVPGVYAQEGTGGESPAGEDQAPLRGAAVYAEFCQACHGPQGESLGSGPAFAAIAYDSATARDVITGGQPASAAEGVPMPAYDKLLDSAQIDDLLAYMATWGTNSTPALPEPNIAELPEHVEGFDGDVMAGAVVYAKFCAGCHDMDGSGRGVSGFPKFEVVPGETLMAVSEGRAGTTMPAFAAASGGPLTDTQLVDLDAYLATWQQPAESKSEDRGLSLLIVVAGVIAIGLVGLSYIRRMRPERDEE